MIRTAGFNARAMAAIIAFCTLFAALPLLAQIAEGDQHYARRAEGASGAHAKPDEINLAIAAYQRAIAKNDADIEAHARLLRAYRYKGAYVDATIDGKKAVYSDAKNAGTKALAAVNRLLTARGVKPAGSEKSVAEAARNLPGAADVYLWDAVNWGEWALVYGKLAAVRQGAADRIRREATIAHLANPALEMGAPARVLGRLHDQTPHIPFLTGWASSSEAVRFLKESLRHDPANKLTLVFLAEAMVSNDSKTRPQAIQLLHTAVTTPLHPDYTVEDAAAVQDAKALLKKWGA